MIPISYQQVMIKEVTTMEVQEFLNSSIPFILPEGASWYMVPPSLYMVVNLGFVMVVGVIGNMLTLLALPYVRYRYGTEFSNLQTSSSSLLLHLSGCDLLYIIVGIPHFIQVYILGYFPYSATTCWWLGMVRHLVAYADFSTIAAIAVSVCSHYLCKTCQEGGSWSNHSDHDSLFGGRRIYVVFLCIWISSFLYIFVDIFKVAGTYGWSAGPYGCSSIPNFDGHNNICGLQHFFGVLVNLIIIIICYSFVARQLWKNNRMVQEYNPEQEEAAKTQTRRHQMTIFFLCLSYVVFILPALLFDWATCFPDLSDTLDTVFIMLYFWVYAINFIIYMMTNGRIRAAYFRFLCDLCCFCVSTPTSREESSLPPWWFALKKSISKVRQSITEISQSIVSIPDNPNEQTEETRC